MKKECTFIQLGDKSNLNMDTLLINSLHASGNMPDTDTEAQDQPHPHSLIRKLHCLLLYKVGSERTV